MFKPKVNPSRRAVLASGAASLSTLVLAGGTTRAGAANLVSGQDRVVTTASMNHLQQQAVDYLAYKAEMQASAVTDEFASAAVLPAADTALAADPVFMQSVDALGTTDNARITALNAMAKAAATTGGSRVGFIFASRLYTTTVPIELWSGLYLEGARSPAREFSTGTCLKYSGTAGTSTFKYVVNSQGYPSDGSPRDVTIRGIQFDGSTTTSVFPIFDPVAGNTFRGHTLWFSLLEGCGFKNQKAVLWGYGDGLAVNDVTHFQSIQDVAIRIGGSENSIFASGVQSLGANSVDLGKPFLQSMMSKSAIGMIMTTMRKTSSSMEVLSGFDLTVIGWRADNQDSDPGFGSGVTIRGGDAIYFRGLEVKGYGTNPAAAIGGAAANRGMVQVLGGTGIDFGRLAGQFDPAGKVSALPTYPLLFVGPNVGKGQVSVCSARTTRTGGLAPILLQSVAGQIVGPSVGGVVRVG